MRVLLLAPHPYFQPRGTPLAERRLVETLTGAGHEVVVLTFPGGEDPGTAGATVRRVARLPGTGAVRPGLSLAKVALDALLLAALLRACRRERPDVVHAVEEGGVMALIARRLHGVPYVYDCDSHLAAQVVTGRPWLRPLAGIVEGLDGAAMRGAVAIVAVCAALAERASRVAPRVPVTVVEDASLLTGPPAGATSPTGGGEPVVLYVGNFERYQGVELLLRAFAHAAPHAPGRLRLVGGRPRQVARLRRLAAALGVAGRVDLPGPHPLARLGELLASATVLVSPRLEGLNVPMKLYSYLDSGRPLLATRVPAHTQLLDEGSALLAEPRPDALGAALARLLRDGELRDRLAAGARRAADRLDPAAGDRRLVELYATLERRLARGGGAPAA